MPLAYNNISNTILKFISHIFLKKYTRLIIFLNQPSNQTYEHYKYTIVFH